MALVPQVVDAVDIPVIAAGGIGDGRGFAAAFMLGAEGVQMGTRFVTAKESNAHQAYKNEILNARDSSTVVTGRSTGHCVRVIKNKMTREMIQLERRGEDPQKIVELGTGSAETRRNGRRCGERLCHVRTDRGSGEERTDGSGDHR